MGHLGGPRGNWGVLGATDESKGESMGPWGQLGQLTVTEAKGQWGFWEKWGKVAGSQGQLGNLGEARQPGVVLGAREGSWNGPEDNGSPRGK